VIVAKNRDQWETHKSAGWAAIVMVWLFVIHFGYSWGPCAWIIVAEIWPLSNRPYGIALGASSNWMNNFIVGQVGSSRPFQCTANAERPLGNTRHDLRNLLRHLPNLRNPNLHRCSIHLVFRP
jgi:hypothetical protein